MAAGDAPMFRKAATARRRTGARLARDRSARGGSARGETSLARPPLHPVMTGPEPVISQRGDIGPNPATAPPAGDDPTYPVMTGPEPVISRREDIGPNPATVPPSGDDWPTTERGAARRGCGPRPTIHHRH